MNDMLTLNPCPNLGALAVRHQIHDPIDWHYHISFRKDVYAAHPDLDLPKYLLAPEIRQLAALPINHHHRMLMLLLFNTGARINELLDLTPKGVCQIHKSGQTITTVTLRTLKQQKRPSGRAPKDSRRVVNLYDKQFAKELMSYIVTYCKNKRLPIFRSEALQHNNRVVSGKRKQRVARQISDQTARNWLKEIERVAREHGIELMIGLSPKVFRHSCAIHMLLNRMPLSLIQKHLGHQYPKNTNIYTNLLALDNDLTLDIPF
ncbi:TPA: site-specific integrase [Vibrio cholerae]|nr:site-specific integrase [Vibrio cholerae]EGR0263945.1 site-specific integrase [Vibrio cholerae]EGR0524934.1 site-specific integrase [Vibrio cholerae]EGR0592898.1 site-specific integrase [Vibrio cholerae]EGR0600802.1 site-specific integrase [Vibrio cholerae]EJL6307313.1 site-specific integrase [Vibrio cholerae]